MGQSGQEKTEQPTAKSGGMPEKKEISSKAGM